MQVSALHLAALTEVFPVAPADRDAARDALRRIFTAAERVLPGGWGDPSAFIRHIGGCLPRGTAASEGLSALAAEDLALAWGCLLQEPRSLEALNRLLHQAAARVGPTGRAGGAEDDLVQVVWQKLLLGPAPKLAQYKGRGNLSSWLRAVVARAAISAG
jgi:RNA polymerase sigma-70 factor, ECF subfamily